MAAGRSGERAPPVLTWLPRLRAARAAVQVALIVYLAHVGSFVPADSAHVPIVDKILTRIHTHESVSLVRARVPVARAWPTR